MKTLRFEHGDVGRVLKISGLDDIDKLPEFLSKPFRRVVLSPTRGESREILERLVPYAGGIRGIFVADILVKDLSPLMEFTGLVEFGLNTYCRTRFDFTKWPHLKRCSLDWRGRFEGLYGHAALQQMSLKGWSGRLGQIAEMPRLERLELIRPRLSSFEEAARMDRLLHLRVSHARRLVSLSGIENLGELEYLAIGQSKGVDSLAPLAELVDLKQLWLDGIGEVETLAPLVALQDLWAISLRGNTNVLDGRVSILDALPRLRYVGFTDRKHYDRVCTHTAHDYLRVRDQPN